MTTIPRTLLDLATVVAFSDLRRALAEADHQRRLDPRAVQAVLGRGRPGSAALREALETHLPARAQTRSLLEERFLGLCETSGIEVPEVNVTVCGLMVDALWRSRRVVVELDGQAAHGRPAAVDRDRDRELTLRGAGFNVLRYSWRQVNEESHLVVADLNKALGAATEPLRFATGCPN